MTDEYDFSIDVPVRIDWANVSLLVTSVQNCFNAMFANVRGSRTVALVTGELLENAIKYGEWREDARLRLSVQGSREVARIQVENPASESAYSDLAATLRWAAGFEDAEAAYRARLLEIATATEPSVSRLGILRIGYEGRCTIDAQYVDGIVRISATLPI
jgi:hypothetical protein